MSVLFVGDPAEGERAIATGHPFTGRASQLLEDGIEVAGLRTGTYGRTFCAWLPQGAPVGSSFKKIAAAAQDSLIPHILLNRPAVVATCGATALKILGGEKRKIADWVAKPFRASVTSGGSTHEFVVFPMWTPGFLMYNDHLVDAYFSHFKGLSACIGDTSAVRDAEPVEYECVTSLDRALEVLHEFREAGINGDVIGWDLETSGLNPHTARSVIGVLSLSKKERSATCIIWDHAESKWSRMEVARWYKELGAFFALSHVGTKKRIKLIAQNGKFDCRWILKKTGVMPHLYADTLLMEHCLDENIPHGLKEQAVRYTDMGSYEDELEAHIPDKSANRAYLLPPLHVVAKYACADADVALRVFNRHASKCAKSPRLKRLVYDMLPRASTYLTWMEYHGAAVDLDYAQCYAEELKGKIREAAERISAIPEVAKFVRRRRKLQEKEYQEYVDGRKAAFDEKLEEWREKRKEHLRECERTDSRRKFSRVKPEWSKWEARLRKREEPMEFNVNSGQHMRTLLYDYLNYEPIDYTDSGEPSTSKVSLIHFKNTAKCAFSQAVLDFRVFSKLLGTYVTPLLEDSQGYDTGQFSYGSYNLTTTKTGRLSSTKPNNQNIPHKGAGGVKRCYISRFKGGHLMQLDYSQIELRLAACISGDKVMRKIYAEGGDIHLSTCCAVYGLTPEKYDALDKDDRKEKRRVAKVFNFGIIYGMSPPGIVAALGSDDPPIIMSEGESEEAYDNFHKRYKGLYRWIEGVKESVRERGFYDSMFGRRRHLPEARSSDNKQVARAERQAVNHPIQSTASDMTLLSGIIISEEMLRRGLRSVAFITIHDAIMFDVFPGETEELVKLARDVMTNLPKYADRVIPGYDWSWLDVPIEIGLDFGYNWRDLIELGSKMEDPDKRALWDAYEARCKAKGKVPDPKRKDYEVSMSDWKTCLEWSAKKQKKTDKTLSRYDDKVVDSSDVVADIAEDEEIGAA